MKKILGLTLVLLLMGVTPSFAQWWSGVGVRAGGAAALLRGDDAGVTDDATDRSFGLSVGLYKSIPLGSGFAIQPEVMYTQKGGELSFEDMIDEETLADIDATFSVDYVEVPVTLAYTIPTNSRFLPMLYAGPYASLTLRRDATLDVDELDMSLSVDGDEFFKRFDYGAVFGADLGFRLKQRIATVGVRYDLGVADIGKDGVDEDNVAIDSDLRNDEWSILVGVRL